MMKQKISLLPHKPIAFFTFVWYIIYEVIIVLINTVIQNEAERNARMIEEYKILISELPKGSLICRKNYYYLKYRENGKIQDKYLGKDGEIVEDIRKKLSLRKHYTEMLEALEQEQKTINKILEGII